MKEIARKISDEEFKYLISLSPNDITLNLLKDFFAYRKSKPPKFQPFDLMKIPNNLYYNKGDIETTVGQFIFNKFVLSDNLLSKIGYKNYAFDSGKIGDLDNELASLLLIDKISVEEFTEYLDKTQWLGFSLAKILNSSLTYDLIVPPDELVKKKHELIEKNEQALKDGDVIKSNEIETELISLAKKLTKDIPDMQIYESGARGSFTNNYKNTTIMRGAIKNLADPSKVKISTSSLEEGIPPEDFANYADLITQASYSRAVGTREGGYEGKKLSAGFQNVVLDDKDSDCGTHKTLKTKITKDNKKFYNYRYIVEGGKLKLLTPDNINSYVGKTVEMRSPMYCLGDKYCNKCAGELYYMLGIKNVGILTNRIGTSLLNAALKAFHDMSLKIVEVNPDEFID